MSNLSRKLIDSLTEEEKLKLSNWAQEASAISADTSLPKKAKIIKLYRVTAKEEVVKSFLRRTLKLTKRHLWDDRTWAGRL